MTEVVAFALGALAIVAGSRLVEERTGLPSAALLVLAGLVYAVVPGPNVTLDPDVVLVLILPPLLYWAALNASLVEIRANVGTVASLSVGLVLVTAIAVGFALAAVVPGLQLAAAIALGAAVAPPDPVASLAIGRRAGLPPRLVTLVEGEGLLNDATALTAFRVAVAAAVGGSFSLLHATGDFLYSAAVGAVVGLALAAVLRWARTSLDDPLIETALSLATPFLAYLPAEALHASGVLAVVIAGLWLGHSAPLLLSGPSRLQSRAVWRLIAFLLEGFVFLLIGNQLPAVIRGLRAYPTHTVVLAATVSVTAVLLVRPLWLYLTSHLPGHLYAGASALSGRELLALSWAGTRGVITLAAVFALPVTAGGKPLAHRDLLLFCAYVVVLATLVGQGLTFAPLLSRLALEHGREEQLRARAAARVAAADAALQRLDELQAAEDIADDIVSTLRTFAQNRRLHGEERLRQLEDPPEDGETTLGTSARLRRAMIDAEREELVRWRDAGRLAESDLRDLERQLDHEEGRLPP